MPLNSHFWRATRDLAARVLAAVHARVLRGDAEAARCHSFAVPPESLSPASLRGLSPSRGGVLRTPVRPSPPLLPFSCWRPFQRGRGCSSTRRRLPAFPSPGFQLQGPGAPAGGSGQRGASRRSTQAPPAGSKRGAGRPRHRPLPRWESPLPGGSRAGGKRETAGPSLPGSTERARRSSSSAPPRPAAPQRGRGVRGGAREGGLLLRSPPVFPARVGGAVPGQV